MWTATASDPNESTNSLTYNWYQSSSCGPDAPRGNPVQTKLGKDQNANTFFYFPEKLETGCITVVVVDSQGASASASAPYKVLNQTPQAAITILPTQAQDPAVPGQPYDLPLYETLSLSGENSTDPDQADKPALQYNWTIQGPDGLQRTLPTHLANGSTLNLPACPEKNSPKTCAFFMDIPGDYLVSLVVTDPQGGEDGKSKPAKQTISVDVDRPPSIVSVSPQTANLSLFANDPTVLSVVQVVDDADPFPPPGKVNPPAGFIWKYREYTIGGSSDWQRLPTQNGEQLQWPLYAPGKIYQFRVEYHDRLTADPAVYQKLVGSCSMESPTCVVNIKGERTQWFTWTVSYR